ncbi:unnamed protein product [Leptidea sinapis]|uniref:P/Homo B domain-containing protein n=1 Tax=Leptidea sinapis TaxID=189913 RepID=A0A5E4Q410_9NEOP|nr:unnamed protein product [Leptidea sinapis]
MAKAVFMCGRTGTVATITTTVTLMDIHRVSTRYRSAAPPNTGCSPGTGKYVPQLSPPPTPLATTDVNNSCTLGHTGTSAAAPLAAGIIALVLQAKAGLLFDLRFGFGLLNAEALVVAALNWTTVPKKHICAASPRLSKSESISSLRAAEVTVEVGCDVNYLEHVELVVSLRYTRRGALEIYLISPQGTKVQLLSQRPNDYSDAGLSNWPLTSVATWGENPNGIWTVIVQDGTSEFNRGEVISMELIMHGTFDMPMYMSNGSRKYTNKYNLKDIVIDKELESSENNLPIVPGQHESQEVDAIDEELLRHHHSKVYLTDYNI